MDISSDEEDVGTTSRKARKSLPLTLYHQSQLACQHV